MTLIQEHTASSLDMAPEKGECRYPDSSTMAVSCEAQTRTESFTFFMALHAVAAGKQKCALPQQTEMSIQLHVYTPQG